MKLLLTFLTYVFLFLAAAEPCLAETIYSDFYLTGKTDGSVIIPPEVRFKINFPSFPKKSAVWSHRISAENAPLANLIKRMRELSFSDFPDNEREVGAVVVNYNNGTSRKVIFTSNRITDIDNEFESKMQKSDLLSDPKSIRSVLHLHTHPLPQNFQRRTGTTGAGVMFSEQDIHLYESLKLHLKNFAGRMIPFTGIVIPTCHFCGDLFFSTKP